MAFNLSDFLSNEEYWLGKWAKIALTPNQKHCELMDILAPILTILREPGSYYLILFLKLSRVY